MYDGFCKNYSLAVISVNMEFPVTLCNFQVVLPGGAE